MAGCEALATKAEVEQLRQTVATLTATLASKIDKQDRNTIVEDSINGANSRYGLAMVPVALPALSALTPYISSLLAALASLISIGSVLAGIKNLISAVQSLAGANQNDIQRIFGQLRFIEEKNQDQDRIIHYLRDYLIPILKADINILKRDLGKANAEITKANTEIRRLNSELSKANAAITAANTEIKRLAGIANTAVATANKAVAETNAINAKLEREYKPVIQLAISKADFAIKTIYNLGNDLIQELEVQSSRINSLERQNSSLQRVANSAKADASRAIEIANNALRAGNQAQSTSTAAVSTANNVSQEIRNGVQIRYFEPTITNAVVRINQQVTNTSIQQASTQIQQTLAQGNQAIQQQFAAAAAASTQIQNTSIQQASDEIQRRLGNASAEIQRTLATAADNVRSQFNAGTIERAIATSPTIQGINSRVIAPASASITSDIEDFRRRLTEQEQVNQRGLTEIGVMAGAIAALPTTLAQNSTYTSAMSTAAAAGTCQTTRPGGCMDNQFKNLQNGQSNLLDKINLGLQSGQGAILGAINNTVNTVNSKLGAAIPGIGIGGKLSNFASWAVADRVMNIVTMFSALHNVMMLSNSVKETFLDVLDNLLQTGYNIAPSIFKQADSDSAIDSREYIGGALNTFFGSLFGVSEWTAIKAQWKAYSTIYSSSAQAYNNLREFQNDAQELMNIHRSNLAELGNALVDEGVISEDNWSYKDPNHKVKSKSLGRLQRMGEGIEQLDNKLEAIEQVTALILNITNTAKEIKENIEAIDKGVKDANTAAKTDRDAKIEGLELPNFSLEDLF